MSFTQMDIQKGFDLVMGITLSQLGYMLQEEITNHIFLQKESLNTPIHNLICFLAFSLWGCCYTLEESSHFSCGASDSVQVLYLLHYVSIASLFLGAVYFFILFHNLCYIVLNFLLVI